MKRSNLLWKVNALNEALTTTECIKNGFYSRIIFGVAVGKGELVIRQYLLSRLACVGLGKALLYAHGKSGSAVVYPLPSEWRNVIERHGFKVANIRSSLLWHGYIIILLAYGIFSICKSVFQGCKGIISPSFPVLGRFAFFEGLTAGNLPQPGKDGLSHDIITWYRQWPGRVSELDTLCHSVKGVVHSTVHGTPVVSVPSAIPPLTRIGALMNYIVWGIAASMKAISDFILGRWWHALMLNEASKAAMVRMHYGNEIASDYLFHNSGWIYRPLWTYEAEKQGSRITFYFYSTNVESFKRSDGSQPLYCGYQAMNWPLYLVWDKYQADFVRRAAGEHVNISVVGQIWFQSSAIDMPRFDKPGVAVFDVTPHRQSRYCIYGADYEFYIPATSNPFLEHIANATRQFGALMLWKRKRKIGSMAHPHYRHFTDRLSEREDVVQVDPGISALRVIEASCAVISMPFTSTALIARELGKPSIYYDPTGQLQRDDRAAHGIPIVSEPDELKEWLSSQINSHADRTYKHAN